MNRRIVTICGLFVAAFQLGFGKDRVDPISKDRNGLALRGYDAVAYYESGRPAQGRAEFSHRWMGATWRFSSVENRDQFIAAPERFAPQFGGYCAWAVGHGYTAPSDPEAWEIIDGKLYLNYDRSVRAEWLKDARNWIQRGNHHWPSLHR